MLLFNYPPQYVCLQLGNLKYRLIFYPSLDRAFNLSLIVYRETKDRNCWKNNFEFAKINPLQPLKVEMFKFLPVVNGKEPTPDDFQKCNLKNKKKL